jgi:transcription elongation factor Elf1
MSEIEQYPTINCPSCDHVWLQDTPRDIKDILLSNKPGRARVKCPNCHAKLRPNVPTFSEKATLAWKVVGT